jgi:hypothetical protein
MLVAGLHLLERQSNQARGWPGQSRHDVDRAAIATKTSYKQVSVSYLIEETHMTTNTTIAPELFDQLLANCTKPEDLIGHDGLVEQLKKALIEHALGAELTEHLGYVKGDPAGRGKGAR